MSDARLSRVLYVAVAAAAAQPPIAVVVFDRPNPLGGEVVEGPVIVDDACASFVGRKPIAVRHGMTFGELAWWGWGDDPKLSPTYPYQ
jgi:uncharacterized protein YbbC (DUF1343 family)